MTAPEWLWGPPVSAEVVPKLQRAALDRMRVFAPIGMIGILTALALSIPAGVPLPPLVITINLVAARGRASLLSVLLARDRVPLRLAHPISAVIWLLAPATTLASYLATHQATLVLPLMIGVATRGAVRGYGVDVVSRRFRCSRSASRCRSMRAAYRSIRSRSSGSGWSR